MNGSIQLSTSADQSATSRELDGYVLFGSEVNEKNAQLLGEIIDCNVGFGTEQSVC